MQTLKTLLPFVLLVVLSAVLITWLLPIAHPYGGIYLPLDAAAIVEHSRTILSDIGVSDADLTTDVQLQTNRALLRKVQQKFGIQRSNLLIRDTIPAYYWSVHWRKQHPLRLSFGSENQNDRQAKDVADYLRGDISFEYDTRGKLLSFERKIPDSTRIPTLSRVRAKILAASFLERYAAIGTSVHDTGAITAEKTIEQPYRTDYVFTWGTVSPVLHDPLNARVTVAGNIVSRFEVEPRSPEQSLKSGADTISQLIEVLLYVVIGIMMVVVAFKRFRSYEIGFRLAFIVGISAGILSDVEIFLSMHNQLSWEILYPLLLAPLFTGGALILIWAVSETVVRESWKGKFVSIDLLMKGHVFHSRIGLNLIRGIALGCAGFAIWLVLVAVGGSTTNLWTASQGDSSLRAFSLSFSWLYVLGHGIYSTLYVYTFCILFALSFLRKYITSGVLLVIVGSLILGVMNPGPLQPIGLALIVSVLVSAIPVGVFYRYDALAAFVTLFTFSTAQETAGLFVAGNPTYFTSGVILAVLGAIAFVIAAGMTFRTREISDFEEIAPAFARHITERQRLQQELEIARNVQMSFLPKQNPVTSKLDIAARCAPALEVGGDYYDFIDLGNQRVGVAIGDVSGKGTQAAFFMTLTKGFLNALAHVSNSPSAVLTQVNKLFYENVERGVFISMVYAIFDTKVRSMTLSRAGHNPVIMRKRKENNVQVVNPSGLALGLDEGKTFAKSIQEVKTSFQPGDLFVFYTDGFPEAMNKTLEEFGEERLLKTVEKYSEASAEQIMNGIFREMKDFTGKAKQHDDMTIVVVKIA